MRILHLLYLGSLLILLTENVALACWPQDQMVKAQVEAQLFGGGSYYFTSATTNTFAQSSGTSGCGSKQVSQHDRIQTFVTASDQSLQIDLARGQGSFAVALASLMGCAHSLQGEFLLELQRNFAKLTPPAESSSDLYTLQLIAVIDASPALKEGCMLPAQ